MIPKDFSGLYDRLSYTHGRGGCVSVDFFWMFSLFHVVPVVHIGKITIGLSISYKEK